MHREPDPDEVNERIKDEAEIDAFVQSAVQAARARGIASKTTMPLRYCRYCGADMMGSNTCPERCTAGEESPLRYADELPERDFYEGESPDY